MDIEFGSAFRQIIGDSEESFFQTYWRQRPKLSKAVVPELKNFYSYKRFLQDYTTLASHRGPLTLGATLILDITDNGLRNMTRPLNIEEVNSALTQQKSIVLQALLLPKSRIVPKEWLRFRDLYDNLSRYLLPAFPRPISANIPISAVDFFCSPSSHSTGGHYDTGDVFYFVLEGQKRWAVEIAADIDVGARLAAEESNSSIDRNPLKQYIEIIVEPGDCLYVPAYTYHKVSSETVSLAVSIGIPTYCEATYFLATAHSMLHQSRLRRPLPTFPAHLTELTQAARAEVERRVNAALHDLFPLSGA
jgi:ribosomal protein L16 Arg81 hydroxylase